ncbi:MAG: DUF3006 domain-containing protein [Oscillospiraceae bacterium]|nr:DUF3006 domain-containing protein [Oscillospiraceae bacterium]
MLMVVDRFEADYAVLEIQTETGELLYKNIPVSWLPEDTAEGDVLRKSGGQYVIDAAETARRRASVREKLREQLGQEEF